MTAQQIIDQALKIAGNTGLASADALDGLNNFLQAEQRRKYAWQRKTVTLNLSAGVSSDATDWDATFLDVYQQKDGSCGRYVIPGSTLPGYIAKTYALDYREYIAMADRLSATGPPRYIVADDIGVTWYVWPVTDLAYTITVDIYAKLAVLTLEASSLWSTFAPEEILVQVVKVWALDYMQDDRLQAERARLYGDDKARIPGMLPTYRRRMAALEGRVFASAIDPRVFPSMTGATRGDAWDE